MLEGAIKICQAGELLQLHVRTFSEMVASTGNVSGGMAVSAVSSEGRRCTQTQPAQWMDDQTFNCKRCSLQHKPKQYPAFGRQCSNCKGNHYFAKQCFSERKDGKKEKSVNIVEDTDLSETFFFVGMVN